MGARVNLNGPRSWKRRTQPSETCSPSDTRLLGEMPVYNTDARCVTALSC